MSGPAHSNEAETVLVTGGYGFVGGWAIVELLRRGYRVRCTIRNLSREREVRATIAAQVDPENRLSIFAADLLDDAGWDRAAEGASFALHVASPMPIGEFKHQDIIRPAREGTHRVLLAARKAGIKRVVMTSSLAAATPAETVGPATDESIWTDLSGKDISDYPRAKTLAEQDAWAFMRESGVLMELATILPGSIQGPVLGSDYSASIELVGRMLRGQMPLLPRLGFPIVDVRDLVDLHIRAMNAPAAAGERFIAAGDFLWLSDIAAILRRALGAGASRVPTRGAPDLLIRAGALFSDVLRQLAPELGIHRTYTSAKAEQLLGWRQRAASASIIDSANSLIERGLA